MHDFRNSIFSFAILAIVFLASCSDSGSSVNGFNSGFAYTKETLDELPNCTSDREQDTAFVEDGKKIYVCEDSRWKFVRAVIDSVKTMDDLPACMDSHEGDSVLVTSLNAIYLCNDGKWEKLDIDDLLESSSSAALSSSSDSLEQQPSSSSAAKVSSSSSVKLPSSSSAIVSSSSEKVSSSSVTEIQEKPNWKYLNPDISYGMFQDSRDGQFYKTVQIGEQIWMAENLNYDYNEGTAKSYCYNDEPDFCAKYGRLYFWSAAMDSAGVFSDGGKGCGYYVTCSAKEPVRGICPEGWHLPSYAEWKTLFTAVGGEYVAGILLKSKSGWFSGDGMDGSGFSVLPAGYRSGYGYYDNAGKYAYFWSSTEYSSYTAYRWYFCYDYEGVASSYYDEDRGYSVRCLRDSD